MTNNYYFSPQLLLKNLTETKEVLFSKQYLSFEERRYRFKISHFRGRFSSWGLFFKAGDILKLTFERGPIGFSFEGLCLSIRSRNFGRKQTSILLRNIIAGVGLELNLCYYLRRIYKLSFSDYKRKQFDYGRPRLYYLRQRINRESRVR